jgi:hypothetical protein
LASSFHTGFTQGYIHDSTIFNTAPEFAGTRAEIPEKSSLSGYVPLVVPQTGGTCMANSFAMARSIMLAKELSLTDQKMITAFQLSPYFLYYLSRDKNDVECNTGLSANQIINTVKNNGFAHMFDVEYPAYFPFTNNFLCPNSKDFYPPILSEHLGYSKKYAVEEVYVTKSVDMIKAAISLTLPVVVGITTPPSFDNLKQSVWNPLKTEKKINYKGSGHAVVIISYDDNYLGGAFQIVNSWGEQWGNKGTAWLRYTDLSSWLDVAFIMEPKQTTTVNPSPNKSGTKYKKAKPSFIQITTSNKKRKYDNKNLINAFDAYIK